MRPVFHLSVPVRDLDEALTFYVERLGAEVGRRHPRAVDISLFGAQMTLQDAPDDVLIPHPRTRHFGATVSWSEWEAAAARLDAFIEPPTISYAGERSEQGKLIVADPSGSLIEIKAYRDPAYVLGAIAEPD
jgi:extradiol dioxygenase family protein